MKKIYTGILLLLMSALIVPAPVMAAESTNTESTAEAAEVTPIEPTDGFDDSDEEQATSSEETETTYYALAYDGTGMLDTSSVDLESEELEKISEKYQLEFRLDIVTDIEDYSVEEVANYYYSEYNYGYGDDHAGILLMLNLDKNESDVSFLDYYLIYSGDRDDLNDLSSKILEALSEQLSEKAWAGNIDDDNENFRLLVHRYVDAVNAYFGDETATSIAENPALSNLKTDYIVDLGGLVTDSEEAELSKVAKEIADTYQCGLYIVTVPNYADYGISINDCTKNIYRDCDLGYGDEKNGFILCMSTDDRDYSLLAYGEFGNYALSKYAFTEISNAFKYRFRDDEWFEGFQAYHKKSRTAMEKAAKGDPWSSDNDLFTIVLVNCLIYIPLFIFGLVFAAFMNHRLNKIMKPVEEASHAYSFVDRDKVKITVRKDHYINTTTKRTYNPPSRSSSSGGSSDYGSSGSSGGGFSGGSGKY